MCAAGRLLHFTARHFFYILFHRSVFLRAPVPNGTLKAADLQGHRANYPLSRTPEYVSIIMTCIASHNRRALVITPRSIHVVLSSTLTPQTRPTLRRTCARTCSLHIRIRKVVFRPSTSVSLSVFDVAVKTFPESRAQHCVRRFVSGVKSSVRVI